MNDVTALHQCQTPLKFQELLETTLELHSTLEPDTDEPATDGNRSMITSNLNK